MSHVLLKRCTGCREYTLSDICPRCGKAAKPNRPAKFSPEDNYGEYRRKLKKLDATERLAGKPTPRLDAERAEDAEAKPAATKAHSAGSANSAAPAPKPKGSAVSVDSAASRASGKRA